MQSSDHIIHVNEADFQYEVLAHSNQEPVVVDFWAQWCVPCRTLDPILEKLAEDASGSFRLAKVDVDANPKLALEYGVQGIPAVKAFRNGQVIAEFNGLRPEPQIREFLKTLGPTTHDLAVGKANSQIAKGEWQEAEAAFREVLDSNPDQPGALLGLAKCLLAQGQPAGALPILRAFPVSKEYSQAEQLLPLAQAMAVAGEKNTDENDLAALYSNALRLAGRGQILAALDGLLELLRQDKQFRRGEARQAAIGLLNLLGEENPLTRQYRTELTSLLF
jgi:putative thioredoxin